MPRKATGLPPPFRPRRLAVYSIEKVETRTRGRGPQFSPPDGMGRRTVVGWRVPPRAVPAWDLTWSVDGLEQSRRFEAIEHARTWCELLERGHRAGLTYDPSEKRFVTEAAGEERPTVLTETVAWWRSHWATVEGKSRRETRRYICRLAREMLRPGAGDPPALVATYLDWLTLPGPGDDMPHDLDERPSPELEHAAAWLERWSLPCDEVTPEACQAYVDRWRINSRTGRPVAPTTLNRHLADLKQCWAWVCVRNRLPNPWPLVQTGTSRLPRAGAPALEPVDCALVLAPAHVRELAQLCGGLGLGARAEAFVLLLGVGGGRLGETLAVAGDDLHLPAAGMGTVTFRCTGWRERDPQAPEDPESGAWLRREVTSIRTVPLPSRDTARLRYLLGDAGAGRLFTDWLWERLLRDVWLQATAEMAARAERFRINSEREREEAEHVRRALNRLHLHDLRHSACSMWLNTPGIPLRIAQEWSGYTQLCTFVHRYQGVMSTELTDARAALDGSWGGQP